MGTAVADTRAVLGRRWDSVRGPEGQPEAGSGLAGTAAAWGWGGGGRQVGDLVLSSSLSFLLARDCPKPYEGASMAKRKPPRTKNPACPRQALQGQPGGQSQRELRTGTRRRCKFSLSSKADFPLTKHVLCW